MAFRDKENDGEKSDVHELETNTTGLHDVEKTGFNDEAGSGVAHISDKSMSWQQVLWS